MSISTSDQADRTPPKAQADDAVRPEAADRDTGDLGPFDLGTVGEPTAHFQAVDHVAMSGSHRALVYTCEHASNRYDMVAGQGCAGLQALRDTHWAYDLGARALTSALRDHTGGAAVYANFSRLVCDANRLPSDPSCIPVDVDGHRISVNANMSLADRAHRIASLHDVYHAHVSHAAKAAVAHAKSDPTSGMPFLFSVHSFTKTYQSEQRAMDIGVLFDRYASAAGFFAAALRDRGYRAALNAPYSGYDGLIYSASRHGVEMDIPYLELEVRNDLLKDASSVEAIARDVGSVLTALLAQPAHFMHR